MTMMTMRALRPAAAEARDWVRILAAYREPIHVRSLIELALTIVPFAVIWVAAVLVAPASPWLALVLSTANALFLVRLFAIQHDCGHGAFFRSKRLNAWIGRTLGVLTWTAYDLWRHNHSIHHATTGNLDRRGTGDIHTMTLEEYQALGRWGRFLYRLYRHPAVVLGVFPTYVFVFENRLPVGFMRDGWRFWISAMGTNLAIVAFYGGLIYLLGLSTMLLTYAPTVLVAATIGIWLFYVQHQFEDSFWEDEENWRLHDAALHGSSHYDLPRVLRWLTANIGIHHVHHLNSRIPFYRLPDVLRDHPALVDVGRLTLRESFACLKLRLLGRGGPPPGGTGKRASGGDAPDGAGARSVVARLVRRPGRVTEGVC